MDQNMFEPVTVQQRSLPVIHHVSYMSSIKTDNNLLMMIFLFILFRFFKTQAFAVNAND